MFPKKILLYILLLCTVSANAQLPISGLSAWYPFCGSAADRSGNSRDLIQSGPALTTDRLGNANTAYQFSGSTAALGNVLYRTPAFADTGNFTYAAWFVADTTGSRIIVANGDINVDGIGIVTSGHNVAIAIGGVATYIPTYITLHQWHHALLRKTGITYSLFLDTVIVGSFTTAFTPAPAIESFAIGQDYTNGTKSFLGKIDDVARYGRALADTEIGALYRFNPDVHAVLGPDAVVCNGFSTTLSPSPQYPGLNYLWSTGSTDTSIVANTLGSYWFSIARPYGCSTSDTIVFTLGSVTVNLGRDTSVCTGDTFLLVPTAPAGSTFQWNTGDTTSTLALTVPGTYSVIINNAGCPGYDTMNFGNSPVPVVNLGPDTVLCNVVPITLRSSVTYTNATYQWNTGATTPAINPTATGTYSLRVLIDGCPGGDSVHVRFKPTPTVAFGPDRSVCQGDSVVLAAISDTFTKFTWSTGDSVGRIVVKATGTYWLFANDSGCTATDTFRLQVNPYPAVHLGPDVSVCQGAPIILSSTDVYTSPIYSWSTGAPSPTLSVTASGSYRLSVTQLGCTGKDSINVTIKPNPVVNLGSDTYFCSGTPYTLSTAQPAGTTYIWSTGSSSSSISVSASGMYGVVVTNNGCMGSDSIHLDQITEPTINLGPDTLLCQGYVMQLAINGDRSTYQWSDGSMGTSYNVAAPGVVWATITNVCGAATDTIVVRYKFCDIWLPNAFTPNGDGRNDVMRVMGSLGSYTSYTFAVFNRWGVNVFLTDDISKGWDGTYKNEEQAIGTYYYIMTSKLNGVEYHMQGDFELIR